MDAVLVVVPAWVLGDGAVPPPSCGDRVGYTLAFDEHHPADGPDPTVQRLQAQADSYAEPWPRLDRSGIERPAWPTTLRGPGWAAHWSAPRELHGVHQLTGRLLVDPLLGSQPPTHGTVTHLHVISERVGPKVERGPRRVVPGSVDLEPVRSSPRWFDGGPTKTPTRTGWHRYTELEPDDEYRRQTGVLATLRLEQAKA